MKYIVVYLYLKGGLKMSHIMLSRKQNDLT